LRSVRARKECLSEWKPRKQWVGNLEKSVFLSGKSRCFISSHDIGLMAFANYCTDRRVRKQCLFEWENSGKARKECLSEREIKMFHLSHDIGLMAFANAHEFDVHI
jgi:hypothetical protein